MELRADSQALLRNALAFAERGWHIFPLRPDDRPGDEDNAKRPAFPARCTAEHCDRSDPRCRAAGRHVGWEERATTDPDRIRRAWSRAPYNIGIACGPSGLLVIDLDRPKPHTVRPPRWDLPGVTDGFDVLATVCTEAGQPLPTETYTVSTGRGGTHLYFRQPADVQLRNTGGQQGNGLGWLIDTRGHGGYVVASGSTVNGQPYSCAHDADPVPLPGWLAGRLRPAPLPPVGPVVVALGAGRRAVFLDKAVQASLDAIAAAVDGTLNSTLWGASVALGQLVAGGELDESATEALLLDAAVRAGHPAAGARRSIRSGFRRGAQRPRHLDAAA
ncbi:bifunctional DNA primase/polymerase [Dactylosporangium sp. CA-092794]|uniref:bifunctional DNA primase/polymerase n=1 Tax=Dactylosporangium sp. CA-092794 TaxID=3239929 RepID=UPI003D8B5B68